MLPGVCKTGEAFKLEKLQQTVTIVPLPDTQQGINGIMTSSVSIKDALEDVDKKLHASPRNDGNEVCIVIPRIFLKDDAAVEQVLSHCLHVVELD